MQINTNSIELNPEDLELLAKIERATGKSIHQLASEAIKNTYNKNCASDRHSDMALSEAVDKINRQVEQVMVAVNRQRQEIALIANNSTKKHSQQSYPPPLVFISSNGD